MVEAREGWDLGLELSDALELGLEEEPLHLHLRLHPVNVLVQHLTCLLRLQPEEYGACEGPCQLGSRGGGGGRGGATQSGHSGGGNEGPDSITRILHTMGDELRVVVYSLSGWIRGCERVEAEGREGAHESTRRCTSAYASDASSASASRRAMCLCNTAVSSAHSIDRRQEENEGGGDSVAASLTPHSTQQGVSRHCRNIDRLRCLMTK